MTKLTEKSIILSENGGKDKIDNEEVIGGKTTETYVPSSIEKLLTNMSNKLGLSLAIYQK
jgi:hypothetical protein